VEKGIFLLLGLGGFTGVLAVMQAAWNSTLEKTIGVIEITFIVHMVGLIATGLILIFRGWGRKTFSIFLLYPGMHGLGGF
jgi:hypothetical protein